MISDFIIIDKNSKTPLYSQIYKEIRSAVESGNLKENEKLPSVRTLCSDLGVSKTTVETAYNALCVDGYIINLPQKGYYVEKGLYVGNKVDLQKPKAQEIKKTYKYDFSGKGIDSSITSLREWRKYIRDILNRDYLLTTYSENQGEEELRKALSKYAFTTRGVITDENRIVIGSGSQTLIYILCGLLGLNKTVAIERNSFPQAEQVFRDFKYNIEYTDSDGKGMTVESLRRIKPDIIMINPNYNSVFGTKVPAARKIEISNYAEKENAVMIEDDYNGELRYKTHPTPCLQSYSPNNTVYIGSFSKILLHSVRISYMSLPNRLIKAYESVKDNYNQTTSKTEQLALAGYITEGKLEKHLRKSRRYYKTKSEIMKNALKLYFPKFIFNETSMYFEIEADSKKLRNSDIKVMRTSTQNKLRLNFSGIKAELIEQGIKEIYEKLQK